MLASPSHPRPRMKEYLMTPQVQAALSWNLDAPMAYLVQEGQEKGHVQRMADEYRRFIGLIAANPGVGFPISGMVDPMWHTHLMFNGDYARMCQAVVGRLIEHNPVVSEQDRLKLAPAYQERTLKTYERMYGEKPSTKWWHKNDVVCLGCDQAL